MHNPRAWLILGWGPWRRYADAADIRDRYNALQTRILELTTAAGPKEDAPPRTLRLGQRVIHSVHGYRGAVCGCARSHGLVSHRARMRRVLWQLGMARRRIEGIGLEHPEQRMYCLWNGAAAVLVHVGRPTKPPSSHVRSCS